MQGKVSTPLGVTIVVAAVLVVGFMIWKVTAGSSAGPLKGIPRENIPEETRSGYDALQKIPKPMVPTSK